MSEQVTTRKPRRFKRAIAISILLILLMLVFPALYFNGDAAKIWRALRTWMPVVGPMIYIVSAIILMVVIQLIRTHLKNKREQKEQAEKVRMTRELDRADRAVPSVSSKLAAERKAAREQLEARAKAEVAARLQDPVEPRFAKVTSEPSPERIPIDRNQLKDVFEQEIQQRFASKPEFPDSLQSAAPPVTASASTETEPQIWDAPPESIFQRSQGQEEILQDPIQQAQRDLASGFFARSEVEEHSAEDAPLSPPTIPEEPVVADQSPPPEVLLRGSATEDSSGIGNGMNGNGRHFEPEEPAAFSRESEVDWTARMANAAQQGKGAPDVTASDPAAEDNDFENMFADEGWKARSGNGASPGASDTETNGQESNSTQPPPPPQPETATPPMPFTDQERQRLEWALTTLGITDEDVEMVDLTRDDINRFYRLRALLYHPDKHSIPTEKSKNWAEQKMRELNEARKLLFTLVGDEARG